MTQVDAARLGPLFFTGTSPFLVANAHFVRALVAASAHCAIHASEDIYDANGLKLWASGRPIDERLLERLSSRKLRKPIELCVYAADPVATAAIAATIEQAVESSHDLQRALGLQLDAVLRVVNTIVPNPTELMLFSVLRNGDCDRMGHAALVCALSLAVAQTLNVHPELIRPLARAALLHDVGELYLDPALFAGADPRSAAQIREIRNHPMIGAQIVVELARSGTTVAHLIAASHERLDGWGYPRALRAESLSLPEQTLLFAEAMAPLLESGPNRLRRAAIAARLIPGEFAGAMVNWIGEHVPDGKPDAAEAASPESIGMDLKQVHSVLTRSLVLLREPERETTVVREAAAQWRSAVESLIWVLRATGVDEALSCGMDVEPQNAVESIELSVLCHELLYRIRMLRLRVEVARIEAPELGASTLVLQLIEAMQACEPGPQRSGSDGAQGATVLPWSRLFEVGVRQIDDQHRILVDLLNRLGASHQGAAAPTLQREILARLVDYVGVHFASEEALMHQNDYPQTAAHEADHARLGARVMQLVAQQDQGSPPPIDELTTFLRQWLTYHILKTDKELGAALNARGVY